ncbi:RNA polymerase sigma factor [Rhizobium daejeonense]|uniref:RNA polymerase sigma factor n=1 Tax=Rhizobium daejeonense TaxID=240521 RepID=A0A6M1RW31_9HYPH|nr:RNA polymerase sigma factor [Rhizobium daejeonense]NGO65944.1 RNA polymerase sigma factor [Rhizobium daejeonense]
MTTKQTEFEALYVSERVRLEKLAGRMIGRSNAPDTVQDVFMLLWSRAREHVCLTPSYLSRATQFTAISHLRAERRRQSLASGLTEEQHAQPVIQPDQIVSARQELQCLQATISNLPARTRQVFLLNRLHDCSYDEIAVALNISYSTVEREIARALLACRQMR